MKEQNEEYFLNYLNSQYTVLLFYIESYLGSKKKGDSFYFLEQLLNILNDVQMLKDKLQIKEIEYNRFYNILLSYSQKIDFSFILNSDKYKKIFLKKYNQIIKQFTDFEEISFLINYKMIQSTDENYVINNILKQALLNDIKVDFTTFKNVMLLYCKKLISFSNLKVEISDKNKVTKKHFYICENDIKELYKKSKYEVLVTIYKQVNLVIRDIKSGIDLNNLDIRIKDKILANYVPNYYELNKDRISFDIDDELYAYNELKCLFKRLNIDFQIDKQNEKEIKKLNELLKNLKRIYNNHEIDINELYSLFVIKNENLIDEFINN